MPMVDRDQVLDTTVKKVKSQVFEWVQSVAGTFNFSHVGALLCGAITVHI